MANDIVKFGDQEIMRMGEDIKLELKRSTVVTPKNYSFENALIAARLILAETTDKNEQPALKVCSQESIHRALLYMAIQGLNPGKNQCYFVVYGNQLVCMRSYMGGQMTAKLCQPNIADIRAQVIYTGDEIEMEIVNGLDIIKTHKRKFQDINKAEIIGAYAIAIAFDSEAQLFVDIMTMEDIKQSWKQSKQHNEKYKKFIVTESGQINPDKVHAKFTAEMAKRTVINRLCKRIINTSDDTALLAGAAETDEDRPETEIIQAEIQQNANKKLLDFPKPKQQALETPQDHPQKQPPAIPMATREQGAKIMALAHKSDWDKEKVLQEVGGFVGRVVTKLRELTFSEAEEFLEVISGEQTQADPDWASN